MVQAAQKLHPKNHFEVIEMEDLNASLGSYDAILFLASFHHLQTIKERQLILNSIHVLLNPSGRIYLTNWNLLGQPRYEKSHRGNGDFDIKIGEYTRYYHGFTLSELEDLFEESGWNIEKNALFE
jgi:SAM-dependent methyltransferase